MTDDPMTCHICTATIERDQLRAQLDALALAVDPSRSVTGGAALIALAQAHYSDSQDMDRHAKIAELKQEWEAACSREQSTFTELLERRQRIAELEQELTDEREKHDEEAYTDAVACADALRARVQALEEAIRSFLEVGKHDMKNPKYDGYWDSLDAILAQPAEKR